MLGPLKKEEILVSFSSLVKTSPSKKVRGGVITGQRKTSSAVAGQTQQAQLSLMVAQTNAEHPTQSDEESTPGQSDSAVPPTPETPGSGGKTVEGWDDSLSSVYLSPITHLFPLLLQMTLMFSVYVSLKLGDDEKC